MNTSKKNSERLRASPSFALAFSLDGKPYVAKETEPYIQYWLSERYRILLSMFQRPKGATISEALDGYLRSTRAAQPEAERKRLLKAIDDMRGAGVLITARDDVSRYDARMARDYLTHRPFPRELSHFLIRTTPITKGSRVLDLAGGPGDLAIALARASDHVTLLDLSRGFLSAARDRAKKLGLNLTTLHESANRLIYFDDEFDVVTVSQALHWLDDVVVCRGIVRVLRPDGSFFVIHAVMNVGDAHPLSYLFGTKSILGHHVIEPFSKQVADLFRRLTLLFDALDAPTVHRHDPSQRWATDGEPVARIVPAGVSLYRQRRPYDIGYARAFLTDQHIAVTGQSPDEFWRDLEQRCASRAPEDFIGTHEWAILHFRRGGPRFDLQALDECKMLDIVWAPQTI